MEKSSLQSRTETTNSLDMQRMAPSRRHSPTKDDEQQPWEWTADPERGSNKGAGNKSRLIAKRSSDGLPHTRSSDHITQGWRGTLCPTTCPRWLRRSARTLDRPGRYLASRWMSRLSVRLRRRLVNEHRARATAPPGVSTHAMTIELSHIAGT